MPVHPRRIVLRTSAHQGFPPPLDTRLGPHPILAVLGCGAITSVNDAG